MDQKYMDIVTELLDIQGQLIGLEAASKGIHVNEDGLIVNGIKMPKLKEEIFTTMQGLNIGQEAAINRSLMGRFFQRLNVIFSTSADSRMTKRAEDLNLLYSGSVKPGTHNLKINEEAINLFLNAWGYQSMRREDVAQTEALRAQLEKILKASDDNLVNAIRVEIQGILILIPLAIICLPIGMIWAFCVDVMFYYYLIMAIFAAFEESFTVGGGREEFIRLISNVIASCYMNGSGKKIKLDAAGRIPANVMAQMKADIDDARARMDAKFSSLSTSGSMVEYEEKVRIAQKLEAARLNIQNKYTAATNRKLSSVYNVMAKNWNIIHAKEVSYNEHAVYCAQLADLVYSYYELNKSCDRNLTTIVRELYKM